MNVSQIEQNVQKVVSKLNEKTFLYDLLLAYGSPKSAVTLLKKGNYNLSKEKGEILWKKKVFFKEIHKGDLHDIIDESKKNSSITRHDPRFLIVTDCKTLLAVDTKLNSSLDISLKDLPKHFDFFLPWAGHEKVVLQMDNPADVKAAEKMAKLYDQILADNPKMSDDEVHSLNVFLSRLLFCFFSEDTGIFEKGAFTEAVASHTSPDGKDLGDYLDRLFEVLNTKDRKKYPKFLQDFPYVNGGLLAKKHKAPKFSSKSRKILIECGGLNWSEINPDIFGSMIQAVVHPSTRGGLGMHYTSVPNIMKVIRPLFLEELYEELEKAKDSLPKLERLLVRMYEMIFFDPACGSGNFLIISYKELRKLEMLVFKAKHRLQKQMSFQYSSIQLNQFYGIELDDFAHEIAILSLWLAQHQMNILFKEEFGDVDPTLPLKEGGKIKCDNALRVDWSRFCVPEKNGEVFIFGNPPYLGSSNQEEEHKADMAHVLGHLKDYKKLDYISCWFYKSAEYARKFTKTKFSFVSTNSICQGDHVAPLWPHLLKDDLEIGFAYQSFKWTNMAKSNAAVICIIISIRPKSKRSKILYSGETGKTCDNINAYLYPAEDVYVKRRGTPICALPTMIRGSGPTDGGNLLLEPPQRKELLDKYPELSSVIKPFVGAEDYINGDRRYCLWLTEDMATEVYHIPEIKKRLDGVKAMRLKSKKAATREDAKTFWAFAEPRYKATPSIIVPRHSSERRDYIPFGFLDEQNVVADSAQFISDADPWIFGLISSKMHMAWVKSIAGKLKSDYRYSAEICYNTFPTPEISEKSKNTLRTHAMNVLQERENHSDKTLAELYDPEKMPKSLLEAHQHLDTFVDSLYRSKPFSSDDERAIFLFKMYKDLVVEKQAEEELEDEDA